MLISFLKLHSTFSNKYILWSKSFDNPFGLSFYSYLHIWTIILPYYLLTNILVINLDHLASELYFCVINCNFFRIQSYTFYYIKFCMLKGIIFLVRIWTTTQEKNSLITLQPFHSHYLNSILTTVHSLTSN